MGDVGVVKNAVARRVESVDALRGFDMIWIVGGDHVVRSLVKVWDSGVTRGLALQMEHCEWEGFRFYDLIFPLFVWIVGVVIPFSIGGMVEGNSDSERRTSNIERPTSKGRGGRAGAVRRVVVRGVILFLLGVFYMGGIANGFENVYLAGVLQRIGVAYLFAGLLFCFFGTRGLVGWAVGLLVGYWVVMTFVPVPGVGEASYEQGKNLAHWVDQRWLVGRKFEGTILSTMAAVGNCLLGVLAGVLLKNGRLSEREKVGRLVGAGVVCLLVGVVWSWQFPIVKLLWTSTYVLAACGISAVLLGVFHWVIEVWGWRGWCRVFVWIGANAIVIYILSGVVNFRKLAERVVGGEVAEALGPWGETVVAVVGLGMVVWVAWELYRRRVFIRL